MVSMQQVKVYPQDLDFETFSIQNSQSLKNSFFGSKVTEEKSRKKGGKQSPGLIGLMYEAKSSKKFFCNRMY